MGFWDAIMGFGKLASNAAAETMKKLISMCGIK